MQVLNKAALRKTLVKRLNTILVGFLLLVNTILSYADTVKIKNASNKTMSAIYLPSDNNKNPILLLHGFLQTNHFSTISRLSSTLNEQEYTLLNPTLSLGINNRMQSLSCEAIHTHSLDTDAEELKQWIDWLYEKTGKKVTLIGHSAGGPVILNYINKNSTTHINHIILISLSYYASGPSANETKEHAKQALNLINKNQDQLGTYALNYCKTYPTYASNFLSYYNWNTEKTSQVIEKLSNKISIIIGTDDKRIDSTWRQQLHNKHNNVTSIEGANHFFDKTHEFDLNDAIENILTKQTRH